jgi:uncharacterized protein YbaP (TraB family)
MPSLGMVFPFAIALAAPTKAASFTPSSFLWRIEGSPPSFLFGTAHVPYDKVWDSIAKAKEAFASSGHLFVEVDMTDPGNLLALKACQLLEGGKEISQDSQVLPPNVYQRLKTHLETIRRNIPGWLAQNPRLQRFPPDILFDMITKDWERKRPVWVTFILVALTKDSIASFGVPILDMYLTQLAKAAGKSVWAVETAEDQCRVINDLPNQQAIWALNQTITQQELGHVSLTRQELIRQYRKGNLSFMQLNQTHNIPGISKSPSEKPLILEDINKYLESRLLEERNRHMADKVLAHLRNRPSKSTFFAFGAGHFAGKDSILDHVRAAGYSVEAVGRDEEPHLPQNGPSMEEVTAEPPKQRHLSHQSGRSQQPQPNKASSQEIVVMAKLAMLFVPLFIK